jgi:hypothetical protein
MHDDHGCTHTYRFPSRRDSRVNTRFPNQLASRLLFENARYKQGQTTAGDIRPGDRNKLDNMELSLAISESSRFLEHVPYISSPFSPRNQCCLMLFNPIMCAGNLAQNWCSFFEKILKCIF